MRSTLRLALLALLLPTAACAYFDPETGAPLVEACTDEDSAPESPVRFGSDILEATLRAGDTCLPCHDPASATNLGFELGGLDLTSHAGLVRGGVNSGASIVVPGRPCDSVLVQKLGAGPPFGSRMPYNGPPFLDAARLARIRDWIAEGAGSDG